MRLVVPLTLVFYQSREITACFCRGHSPVWKPQLQLVKLELFPSARNRSHFSAFLVEAFLVGVYKSLSMAKTFLTVPLGLVRIIPFMGQTSPAMRDKPVNCCSRHRFKQSGCSTTSNFLLRLFLNQVSLLCWHWADWPTLGVIGRNSCGHEPGWFMWLLDLNTRPSNPRIRGGLLVFKFHQRIGRSGARTELA